MSILERFSTIIKANINDLLDRAEDPAKMMDQYMRQLMSDLGVDIDPNALVDELETAKSSCWRSQRHFTPMRSSLFWTSRPPR